MTLIHSAWSNGASYRRYFRLDTGQHTTVTITERFRMYNYMITYVVGNSNSASLTEDEDGVSLQYYIQTLPMQSST
jgi:hypothetical protein